MNIKKTVLYAMVLGMAALSAMATNHPIDWDSPCIDGAIIAMWWHVLPAMHQFINNVDGALSSQQRYQIHIILFATPPHPNPSLEVYKKVEDIVGAGYMQKTMSVLLIKYVNENPCIIPTPTLSPSASSSDSATSSDSLSSSDSTTSSDSSSSDVSSSATAEPTSVTTDTYSTFSSSYSSAPTSQYSTIPPHKCYAAVVVTSRLI
ncbi:hypothetical protein IWW57_000285 [Coemansia sp. S610]|nr:hypothetical protein IWW57_000285 [Coemansia sp. S610]